MSEAPAICQRGTFYDHYAIPSERRDKRARWPRLLESLVQLLPEGHPNYLAPMDGSDFAVVDLQTREKGWFEIPPGATLTDLTCLIENHFAARAQHVSPLLWVV
jgi:hypothetical protein